jgi:hypothetical protein
MIRQAISCDICASEKKQTNHWFVAYEQSGELRVGGWNSRNRQKPGAKHLCGQTCLHKLVDDFMARTIVRTPIAAEPVDAEVLPAATDTSLTVQSGFEEFESSARLITPAEMPVAASPAATAPRPAYRAPAELVRMPARAAMDDPLDTPVEPPRYSSRSWRSEAWEREREREQRAAARLRSNG